MLERTFDWPAVVLNWLCGFFLGPVYSNHPLCRSARSWYDEFKSHDTHKRDEIHLLKHAQDTLTTINATVEHADKFAEWQHMVSAALAGALLVSDSKVALHPVWKFIAVSIFAVVMLLVIWARFPRQISVPVTGAQALDRWPEEIHPLVWLAASTHCTTIERVVLLKWKRRRLAASAFLMACGIFCWLLAVVTAVSP